MICEDALISNFTEIQSDRESRVPLNEGNGAAVEADTMGSRQLFQIRLKEAPRIVRLVLELFHGNPQNCELLLLCSFGCVSHILAADNTSSNGS
jgi:hypothetical protein